MKIKCSFCEAFFNDTMEHCPNCGAANPGVVRTHSKQPLTIDELKQWYESKDLPPYDVTRFLLARIIENRKLLAYIRILQVVILWYIRIKLMEKGLSDMREQMRLML